MEEELYLGSHCSMNAPDFYVGTVKEALSYGSNTFMFYTGAPQNSYRTPIDKLKIEEGRALLKAHHIDESKIIVHGPYIINGANKLKPELWDLSIKTLVNELRRTAAFGVSVMVLHPGAHVGQGSDIAIQNLVEALDIALEQDGTNVKIALETMAGKGTEIGITFEQIAKIISLCHYPERLGVCLDTCHMNDAGYNVHDVDELLEQFDKIVGLDKVLVVHINDSKNPIGAHKDRHENIGYGEIGFQTLYKWIHHPKLTNIPKILETPYFEGKPPYKEEISLLRSGEYTENWRDNL